MARKAGWNGVSSTAAFLAGTAVYKLLELGWKAVTHREPPTDVRKRNVGWGQALGWAAGTAALVGAAGFAAEHGTKRGLERLTGRRAPT